MPAIKIPTVFNIDLEYELADFIRRAIAYLVDLAIRIAWVLLVIYIVNKFTDVYSETRRIASVLLITLPIAFYYLVSEVIMDGQSLGKKVTGLKVVSLTGSTPTTSQILLRWMFRLIESPFLAFMWIFAAALEESVSGIILAVGIAFLPIIVMLRSNLNQRLGDITAGTIVIRGKEKTSLNDTIFREVVTTDYVPQFSQVLRLSDRDLSKIKSVLDNAARTKNSDMAARVGSRVKQVLQIETDMEPVEFLETLLNDYNYLVQKG